MLRPCPECDGNGYVIKWRPEPWVSRDTPPSTEEYQDDCTNCGGYGEIEIDPDLDLLDQVLHQCSMLKTYLEQLHEQAIEIDVPLLKVFTKAGVPTSTYYRTIGGKTHLKYETAMKVAKMIAMLKEGRTLKRNDKRKL